jgi:hypothetical protein
LALGSTLVLHAALLVCTPLPPHEHGRLATYALSHWPAWYRPAPGVFADRITDLDLALLRVMPIGFARPDGTVSKLLVDRESLPRLDRLFVVDPIYLSRVGAQAADRSGPYYLNPPEGAVRSRCAPGIVSAEEFREAIHLRVVDPAATTDRRQLLVWLDVANDGGQALCNLGSGGRVAFNVTTVLRRDGRRVREGARTRGPQVLIPGTSERQLAAIALPAQIGRYEVDVLPVLETVGRGNADSTLIVEVVSTAPSYKATIALKPPFAPTP